MVNLRRNSVNGTIIERGRCLAPFDAWGINGSHVPEVSPIVATPWVISMKLLKLLLQVSGGHVALIPELHGT